MSTMIQAYFNTEDKAYQSEIELKKYDIDFVEIAPLKEQLAGNTNLIPPIAFTGMGTGATQAHRPGGPIPGRYILYKDLVTDGADGTSLNYTLEAKVKDEDAEKIIEAIRKNEGHVAVAE